MWKYPAGFLDKKININLASFPGHSPPEEVGGGGGGGEWPGNEANINLV